MNERIRYLRKSILHISQDDFAKEIGISRSNLGNIETGAVNLTERVISDVCRVFNVNETWLRSGEGDMFVELPPEDMYFKAATELSIDNDELAKQIVIEYWKLDKDSRKLLKDFILRVAENIKNSDD